ncbi:hemagglutinin/amebocyte aggregation factor-like [Oculina patagonica]
MAKKTLAKLLLLLLLADILLVSGLWGGKRRRRRRCSSSSPAGVNWLHSWHQSFHFKCDYNYSLRYWRSHHRDCLEDRIHYFRCGYGPVRYQNGDCAWSHDFVNAFRGNVDYKCSHNGFITGVSSTNYNGSYRDRRFGFRCCHVNGYIAHTCQTTLFRNSYDQDLSYSLPWSYYLVGVFSVHNYHYGDRMWKFEICQFKFVGKK